MHLLRTQNTPSAMRLVRVRQSSIVALSLIVLSVAFVPIENTRRISPFSLRFKGSSLVPPTQQSISPRLFSTMPSTSDTVLDDALLDQVLEVAMDASRKAGEIILGNAGGAEVTERKANSRDLLTLIDPLCEKIIKETVLETFPSHDFLGEEDVAPGKEASAAALDAKLSSSTGEWLWIVDPIDGTTVSTTSQMCFYFYSVYIHPLLSVSVR